MILNVSGRSDIVAFYSEWFINRYNEGYLDVRNPFNEKLVSRIFFEDVDAIVFCTKNPIPFLKYLDKINKPFVFQITLTPYHKDIESNLPDKIEIINAIKEISNIIGKENVYLRYDPIFLSEKYNINYHIKAFDKLCSMLKGYVEKIIISFIDEYKNVKNNQNILKKREFTENDYKEIGINFSKIAKENLMTLQTCYEKYNLVEYGFKKDVCVSYELVYKLTGKINFKKWKARECGCAQMVDIGVYNTCKHFCKYCYANYDEKRVDENSKLHDKNSSLLIGRINKDDIIKIRRR